MVISGCWKRRINIPDPLYMATLFKGDCLEIMKGLPDKSVDCFVCDLPYGCLHDPVSTLRGLYINYKWDIQIDLQKFWLQVKRLAKNDNTPVLMFCNARFGNELYNSNPKWFRYDLIWSKTNAVGFLKANKMPMASHELIYVFSKKGAYYKRINYEGDFPKGGGGRSTATCFPIAGMPNLGTTKEGVRCPTLVITISNKKIRGAHPTQKPEELYEWLLRRYCPDNGVVLDPTAGSFTSVFTATKLGLKAIGIEMNPAFFWKAVQEINR